MTRAVAVIERELLPAGPSVFGPVLLPEDATSFSLLFPVTEGHVGWSLDTFVSVDYGLSWAYAGGCARAQSESSVVQSGLSGVRLPLGQSRLFRIVLTLTKPLVMQGLLECGTEKCAVDFLPVHHSVAFDNSVVVTGTSVTTVTTGSFTISGTALAAMLQALFLATVETGITGSVGGVSATAISGTDATSVSIPARTYCMGVTGPPTGSQTGTLSWTTASSIVLGIITASGVDQAVSFNNGNSVVTSLDTSASLTVTSTNGDMTSTVSYAVNAEPTTNQTQRWTNTNQKGDTGGGTGTTTHTWTAGFSNYITAGANFVQDTSTLTSHYNQLSESGGMVGRRWR